MPNLDSTVVVRHTNGSRRLLLAELSENGLALVRQPGSKLESYMIIHVQSGRPLDNHWCQYLHLDIAISRYEQLQGYCNELGVDLTLSPAKLDQATIRDILSALD